MSRHHLDIENQTGLPVKLNVLFGGLVAPLNGRYIFESYGTARDRIGPNDLLLDLILGPVGHDHLHGPVDILLTTHRTQSLQGHLGL